MRKKPDAIDLTLPLHRTVLTRAYHAQLSQGGDEQSAKRGAVRYALQHWDDLTSDL